MGSCRPTEMLMGGQVVLEKVSVTLEVVPQCCPRSLYLLWVWMVWKESGLQVEENYELFPKSGCELGSLLSTGRSWYQQMCSGECWAVCGAVGSFLWEFAGPIPALPWPDAWPLGLLSCTLYPFHVANRSHQWMSEILGCEQLYTSAFFPKEA